MEMPLEAAIINARRGREGLPGLYGPKMRAEVRRLRSARVRSRRFIASGWLDAIRAVEPFAGQAVKKNANCFALAREMASPRFG